MADALEFVLDSGAIVHGANLSPASCLAPPTVEAEFAPGGATRRRLDLFLAAGLRLVEPRPGSRRRVEDEARRAGSLERLSSADLDVLALALDRGPGARLVSDDHTVLDVARRLQLATETVVAPGITRTRDWAARCTGCGRRFGAVASGHPCPVCGAEIRNKPVRRGQKV